MAEQQERNIIDLTVLNSGETVRGLLLIKDASIRQASNGPYCLLTLTDGKQDIQGKIWQYSGSVPNVGYGYQIVASVDEYKGQISLNVKRIVRDTTPGLEKEFRPTHDSPARLFRQALVLIDEIKDEELAKAVKLVYKSLEESIIEAPAAKVNHHAYVGGLLEHTLAVTELALDIAKGRDVDTDYIIAGGLLHDIGKTYAYKWSGMAISYTNEGMFEDHLPMSYNAWWNHAIVAELSELKASKVAHIILSHHGKLEHGSPVLPRTPEAFIVHIADSTDSTLNYFKQAKEITQDGDWSQRLWPLQRNIYVGD